jgi:PAS domain S-box-containing protein
MLVLTRPLRWQLLAPALAVVTALGNLAGGRPPLVAALFGVANAAEAVVIAGLLTGGGRGPARLETLADVRRLVVATAAGAGVLGLLGGAVVMLVEDGSFWATFRSGGASHAASDLVIVPLIMLATSHGRDEPPGHFWRAPGIGRVEATAQLLATSLVLLVVFLPERSWPTSSLTYAVFVWAGLRLTCIAAMTEVLAAAVFGASCSAYGRGPFGDIVVESSVATAVGAMLEAFIATLALVTLTLGISARQRRAALAAATQERDFIASLVDTTRALLLVLDTDLRVVSLNGAARRASGRELEELVGRPPWETVLSPEDEGRVRELAALGAHVEVELPWSTGPSSRRTVAWTAARLSGDDRAILMTGIDVTGHRDSERLFRTVLDANPRTAILGLSRDGRIVFANSGAQRMLDRSAVGLVDGVRLTDLHDPEQLRSRAVELGSTAGFATLVASIEHAAASRRQEWTWLRRDGTALSVLLTLSRTTEDSSGVAYVCFAEDAGERRRTEQALQDALAHEREAVEHLHEVDRLKSTFVASVSHELRTPLTSMLGFVHLLGSPRGDPLTPHQRHLLARLDRNGRRLLAMVEDLLVLSRIEAGPVLVEGAPVDLRDAVTGALQLTEETLEGRDLRLVVRDEGPCVTWGEETQLERVLVNLVSNAVKFTPDGGEIRVECAVEDRTCVLRVSDTGVGIPETALEHVFEAFYRAPDASAALVPGTGLGLAIVARVVEAHRGTVTCRSSVGVGTVFEVRLPLADDSGGDQ